MSKKRFECRQVIKKKLASNDPRISYPNVEDTLLLLWRDTLEC